MVTLPNGTKDPIITTPTDGIVCMDNMEFGLTKVVTIKNGTEKHGGQAVGAILITPPIALLMATTTTLTDSTSRVTCPVNITMDTTPNVSTTPNGSKEIANGTTKEEAGGFLGVRTTTELGLNVTTTTDG